MVDRQGCFLSGKNPQVIHCLSLNNGDECFHYLVYSRPRWAVAALYDEWPSFIPCFAHFDIDRNCTEERDGEFICDLFATTLSKEVNLLPAVRADHAAHVLDDPKHGNFEFLDKFNRFPRIKCRDILRGCDDYCPAEIRGELGNGKRLITSSWRQVNNQVIE